MNKNATSPIDKLLDSVEAAIREYDRSNDHLKHGANSDCIRCALVEALPPGGRDRVARSKTLSRAIGAPVDVVREAPAPDADDLLRRALPLLVRLGDFVGNGAIDPRRENSLGERCDLIGDIKKELGL